MGDGGPEAVDRIKPFRLFILTISSSENEEKFRSMGMMTVQRGTSSTGAREEDAEVDSRDLHCPALRVCSSIEDESLINLQLCQMKVWGGRCLKRGGGGGCHIEERPEASWERVSCQRGEFCPNTGRGERPYASSS